MLSDAQIYNNKLKYLELLSSLPTDTTAFRNYLDCARMDFFNKPFSVYPSGAYAGALCEHSLKIYTALQTLCDLYMPGIYTKEQLIQVALFGNLYRGELYEPYLKNVKNEQTNEWESVLAYRNKEERPVFGDIGFGSYMIAKKFFILDDDEVVEAICQANTNNLIDCQLIRTSYKLVTLTAMAELAASYLI